MFLQAAVLPCRRSVISFQFVVFLQAAALPRRRSVISFLFFDRKIIIRSSQEKAELSVTFRNL